MKVFVINGKPGVGKDTFVEYVKEAAPQGYVLNVSTVDKVKEIAKYCGWDGTKDGASRKFLSDLKQVLTVWKDIPLNDVSKKIAEWVYDGLTNGVDMFHEPVCVFIHSRERAEIGRLIKEYRAKTIHVFRDCGDQDFSNDSDKNANDFQGDYTIINNGTKEDLRKQAEDFYNNNVYTKDLFFS